MTNGKENQNEHRQLKILAADDDERNLRILRALIKEQFPQAQTMTASNGQSCIEIAADHDPDIILLDVMMPGMDGFETCRKLRENKSTSDIPVVFLTALQGDKENRIRALEAGADAFLSRPIDRSELCAQILAMAKIRKASLEKRHENERLSALIEEQTLQLKNAYSTTLNLLEELKRENEARKDNEKLLTESEAKQKAMIANISDVISIISIDGIITYTSPNVEKRFGWKPEDLIGSDCWKTVHPNDLQRLQQEFFSLRAKNNAQASVECRGQCGDGSYKLLKLTAVNLSHEPHIRGILINYHDITERKNAEEKIKSLLNEKNLILKEVHHRIKNNISTMKSLFSLQAAGEKNPETASVLHDAQSRLQGMAVLYDKLYLSENLTSLSVKDYLSTLIPEVVGLFPIKNSVQIEKSIEEFTLDVKVVSNLGIIINELLTNIMKHAVTRGKPVIIKVFASKKGNLVSIVVEDNGPGIPASFDSEKSNGFGLMLVRTLMKQLSGEIVFEKAKGTRITLNFKI